MAIADKGYHRIGILAMSHAALPNDTAQVALYLDLPPSPELIALAVAQCQAWHANLLCLAPPPIDLASASLAPYLSQLERAGIAWDVSAAASDLSGQLQQHPEIVQLICDGRSSLTQQKLKPPVPMLIVFSPNSQPARAESGTTVDWLAPRFNRGF